MTSFPGQRNEVSYECCEAVYVDLTFELKMRRRTLYYFFNLIMPCMLIGARLLMYKFHIIY